MKKVKMFIYLIKVSLQIILFFTSNILSQQNFPLAPEIWSEPVILDTAFAKPNSLQESASFTANIDTAYFEGGTGIYMSYKKDGKWTSRMKLNKNINDVNIAYRNPSISKNGRRLYFSAWKGYGGWDIWYSDWDEQTNDWGKAYNMGPVINNAGDQMYLYEVSKDTVFCLSYGSTNLYSWNYLNNSWAKIDSFWYHELGVGDKYGLSVTGNRKKIYFAKLFAYKHINGKPFYNIDIFVTYWDSTKNYWGDVYSLNINTEPTLYPDSSKDYGGTEKDPWISSDGKILIFTSTRGTVYDSVNTDEFYAIYISYLLVDEHGNPVSVRDEESSDYQLTKNYKIFNYPNPFNSSTTIQFEIPIESEVTIKLYDSLGKEITTILKDRKRAGKYKTEVDFSKYKLSSGVYLCTLLTKGAVITNKLIYLK